MDIDLFEHLEGDVLLQALIAGQWPLPEGEDMMITGEELLAAFDELWRGHDKRLAAGGASSSEAGPPADP